MLLQKQERTGLFILIGQPMNFLLLLSGHLITMVLISIWKRRVPRFITSCILDEPIRVHGDGMAARDFIFVEDVCAAIDIVIHTDIAKVRGDVFNVASSVHRSILSIARDVVKAMDKDETLITCVGDRPGQVFRHTGDITKIKIC